jgi:hypothetical protein
MMSHIENHIDEDGGKPEVVITEAMIETGLEAYVRYLKGDEPGLEKMIRIVFLQMSSG